MERDSIIYKTRRNMQMIAHKLFSNEAMSKFYYRIVLKKQLHLENPKTFNEKLQWLKLYYFPNNSTVVDCADKYTVRKYLEQKGYKDLLVPLIDSWETVDEINWDALPNQFVLKCNHGCAYNVVCSNKGNLNIRKTQKKLKKWMAEDFGAFNIELHYSKIKKHRIICEQFLGETITDYKFFCFNGEPKCIYVSTDLVHDRQAEIGFFNLDGSKMPLKRDDYTDISQIKLPPFYEDMKSIAKELCKEFPFVRVDFFVTNDKYYFAELTFTPGACMMPFNPDKYDLKWGEQLDISALLRNRGNNK